MRRLCREKKAVKIALATRNKGKIAELEKALREHGFEPVSLLDLPDLPDPEETGATFAENALIKAAAMARATRMPAIADDSGLMVEALAGAPAVYSARFADDWQSLPGESRDQRNIRKLLHLMRAKSNRACKFVAVMACVLPCGKELTTKGEWAGYLLPEPVGVNGFGYDPVFLDPELGLSAAQLTKVEKNMRSHRGKACRELLTKLPQFLQTC